MRRFLVRRLLIALLSLWVALSLVFLIVRVAPGDFLAQKLAALESQGAEQRPTQIVGAIIVEHDAPLSEIAVEQRLVREERAEDGAALLLERNPNVEFPLVDGELSARAGTELTLRERVTIADLAYVHRIDTDDILDANPAGSLANPDGQLAADTVLHPGDWIVMPTTTIVAAGIRHRLGFDRSLGAQYGDFLWHVVRFDFGASVQTQESALSVVEAVLPRTVQLNLYALIVAALIGLPLGFAALRLRGRRIAAVLQSGSAVLWALPSFWLVLFLSGMVAARGYFFEDGLWWIPLLDHDAYSITSSPTGFLALYSIPAVAAGLPLAATIFAACAPHSGDRKRDLREIARRLLAALRIQLPILIGFNFILELMFALPGLGLALFGSLSLSDTPLISAVACVTVLFMVFCYFAIDMARAWLDREARA